MPAPPAANTPTATPQTPTPMTPAAPRPPVAQAPVPPNPPRAPRNPPAVNILPVPVLARIPGRGRYWGGSGIEGSDEPSVSFTSSAPSDEPPTIVPASAPATIALAPATDPSPEPEQPASPGPIMLAQNPDVAPTPLDIGSDATSPAVTVSRSTSTAEAPTGTVGTGMSDDAKCKLGAGLWTGSGVVLGKAALDAGSLLTGGLLGVAAAACFGIAAYLWSSRTPPRLPKVSISAIDQAKNAVNAANQGHGQDQIRENQDCDDVRLGIKFGNQATSNSQLREMGIPTQPRSVPQDINQH